MGRGLGDLADLECFFGQTAQLTVVSAAGSGLAMHIIGIEDQEVLTGS